MDFKTLSLLFNQLYAFYLGKIVTLDSKLASNAFLVHYFMEIVRFWNTINYIIKKTFRYIREKLPTSKEISVYFYSVYIVQWENASIYEIKSKIIELSKFFKSKKGERVFGKFIKAVSSFSLKIALENKEKIEKLSIEQSIPSFFIEKLLNVMDYNSIKDNIVKMNSQRKFDYLRVNHLKLNEIGFNDLEEVKKEFEKLNITLYPENLPYLYYTPDKVEIVKTSWYQEGLITFQDKGSVLIVDVLNPHPKDIIYDMCAGPGMKTSLMAQKMHNNGTIIAIEFLKSRSEETKRLLENFNVQNTFLLNSDSISPPIAEHFKFDKILLDAPCTGSGTFQIHPELKYRQNSQFLHQNVILQEKLIVSAKKYLKPGGVLLYSVCSLYPEEGELHFQKPKTKDLIPMDLPKYLADCYIINGENIAGAKRLFPSKHNTSGFFIAKFKKKD